VTSLALPALPGIAAIALWALLDTERFVLWLVLSAMVLSPLTLFDPGGAQIAAADVLLLLAAAACAVRLAVGLDRELFRRPNVMMGPLLVFVTYNAVSIGWSVDPGATVKMVVQMVEIALLFPFLFAALPQSLRTIGSGLTAFVVASSALSVLAFVAAAPQLARGEFNAVDLGFGLGNKNAAGSFIAAGFVIAYLLLLGRQARLQTWVLRVCLGLETLGMVATLSRGSIIGAVAAVLVASLLLRRGRILTGAVATLAVVVYFGLIAPQAESRVEADRGAYSSDVVRVYSFNNAIDKIQARPVLGTGSGTYQDYLPQVRILLPDPNNMFLLTWAEIGVFGVAALLLVLVTFGRLWWRMRGLPDDAAVLGVTAGAVAFAHLVHFQFDVTWTRGTTSMCFAAMGLMAAVARLAPAAVTEPTASRTLRGRTSRPPARRRPWGAPAPAAPRAQAEHAKWDQMPDELRLRATSETAG
jgi:O-antigen ligase